MSRLFIASLVVVCLLGASHVSWAQTVSAGFKAGVTAARLPGVTDAVEDAVGVAVDEESRWGGTGGVFVTWRLNDLVAFQPEVLYAVKGTTLVGGAGASSYSLAFDTRYLDIPLLFRLGRPSQRLYVLAGPYVGFRLDGEAREVVGAVTETQDVADQIKRVDAGIAFGVGSTFDRFLLEVRWTEGLRDVESADRFGTAVRHRVLAVLAGFRF